MCSYDYVSPRFPPRCAKGGNGRLDSRQREEGGSVFLLQTALLLAASRSIDCQTRRRRRPRTTLQLGRLLPTLSRARGSTDSATRPPSLPRLGSSSLPSTSMLKQPMSLKRYTRTIILFPLELTSIPSAAYRFTSLKHPRKWVRHKRHSV